MAHQKRLSAPKHYPIERKDQKYITTIKGSRSPESSIPALLFLREITEYADTKKEAKKIVREGKLLRNGEPIRDIQQGLGILDTVELPEAEEKYLILTTPKGVKFKEIDQTTKIGKITGKKVQGDQYIYRLHNGENFQTEKEFQTGSTLLIEDEEEIQLQENANVLVKQGQHAGKTGTLEKIEKHTQNPDTATIQTEENGEFRTQLQNLIAINQKVPIQ